MNRLRHFALLFFGCLLLVSAPSPLEGASYYPQPPAKKALNLSANLMGDGLNFITLDSMIQESSAKVHLLYYFSATCPHCIQAGPSIAELSRSLKPHGVKVIGITSSRNSLKQIRQYQAEFDITFPIYRDSTAAFARDNGVRVTPTVYLVSKTPESQSFRGFGPGMADLVRISAVKMAGGDALSLLKTDHYNGARVCSSCHIEEYRSWATTHHSVAFYTLKDEKERTDPECVSCHVTGWEKAGGFQSYKETPELMHVGCENCHGIAVDHAKPRAPKQDLITQYAPTCNACHDKKHSIGFTPEKGLPLIMHSQNRDISASDFQALRAKLEKGEVERPLIAFPEGKIMGNESCKKCHTSEYKSWKKSAHANAMSTLKEKGMTENTDCLQCHAVLTDSDKKGDHTAYDGGVGCESCHGPGEEHVAAKGGTENIVGLTESCPVCVIEAMCTNCHTQEQDADFDLDRDLPKAGHGKTHNH